MKVSLGMCLLAALLCPGVASAAPGRGNTEVPPVPDRTKALRQKLKQLAEAVRAKHATVDSVAAPIGPWKLDEFSQCELTPRDPEFRAGRIDTDRSDDNSHAPTGKQPVEGAELTLATGAELTPRDLERVFGKWRTVPPPPEGNPYQIVFYYPNSKALLSVAVFAELNGLPQKAATKVTSISFRRDDFEELRREK